jgi:hypothetical protein
MGVGKVSIHAGSPKEKPQRIMGGLLGQPPDSNHI